MNLGISERLEPILEAVRTFIRDKVEPANEAFHEEIDKGGRWTLTERQVDILDGLKAEAREQNLWNFWLTDSDRGHGLTTVEYAYIAEETGRSHLAAEAFNCSAPDTGNMEVLERFGSGAQKEEWLVPLLDGRIRSAYAMTEPGVASSDATNISTTAASTACINASRRRISCSSFACAASAFIVDERLAIASRSSSPPSIPAKAPSPSTPQPATPSAQAAGGGERRISR